MSEEKFLVNKNDLQDGQTKKITIGDHDILLSRIGGRFFRDGFMAVHDSDTSPTRPQVRLYDIGEAPVLAVSELSYL